MPGGGMPGGGRMPGGGMPPGGPPRTGRIWGAAWTCEQAHKRERQRTPGTHSVVKGTRGALHHSRPSAKRSRALVKGKPGHRT